MNKRQLKKLALITTASEIIAGNSMDCVTDNISEADQIRFEQVRYDMAYALLRRVGLNSSMSADEAINFVLKT